MRIVMPVEQVGRNDYNGRTVPRTGSRSRVFATLLLARVRSHIYMYRPSTDPSVVILCQAEPKSNQKERYYRPLSPTYYIATSTLSNPYEIPRSRVVGILCGQQYGGEEWVKLSNHVNFSFRHRSLHEPWINASIWTHDRVLDSIAYSYQFPPRK